MSSWTEVTIGDLGKVVTGSTPPSRHPEWFGNLVPFVTPSDMTEGDRRPHPSRWLSGEGRDRLRKRLVPSGAVAFVSIGATIGKICLLPEESVTNQQINTVVPYEDIDNRFVYYLLKYNVPAIAQAAGGAATPIINKTTFSSISVMVPEDADQVRIGEVLGTFDDLIENNRRRIELLEEMARTIYHEWFVKFRYPGHEEVPMVDSELGMIPEGWQVQELSSVARVNDSSRKPNAEELFKYLDISSLAEREIGDLNEIVGSEAPGRARRVVQAGDIVWATVRPNRRAHALLVDPDANWIASTGLAVITPTEISSAYLFEAVSAQTFSDWLVSRATGSAYPAVRAKDFEEALMLVPETSVEDSFVEVVAPMHKLSWALHQENKTLASMRDLLLPKLVTGQIDVSSLDLGSMISEKVN
ncbi:MAG: hypothetical protein GX483_01835 [Actinomycetaceae bacterium]|nr:hypothetical protein [Actinomycetaceae bacterium]